MPDDDIQTTLAEDEKMLEKLTDHLQQATSNFQRTANRYQEKKDRKAEDPEAILQELDTP